MSKTHVKHTKLNQPQSGKFHRNEIGFLGAPCGVIQDLCQSVADLLKNKYKIAYVDADHGESTAIQPFQALYTDKISHHQLSFQAENMQFIPFFEGSNLVLVNGNHFQADRQMVLIHPDKEDSLRRKLDRLTDVMAIVLTEGVTAVFPWLMEEKPELQQVPVVSVGETNRIAGLLEEAVLMNLSPVKGLVLAGGQSQRMGKDKTMISYHGKPQTLHVAELLETVCTEVHISVKEYRGSWKDYPQLEDTFMDLGPYGAILSAFRSDPSAAWLVVASDMPLLDLDMLATLVKSRDSVCLATCYHNPETGFPEPLLTLWEPRAYARLLYFLSRGISCPRKVLINSNVKLCYLDTPGQLKNANTPEEFEQIMGQIRG